MSDPAIILARCDALIAQFQAEERRKYAVRLADRGITPAEAKQVLDDWEARWIADLPRHRADLARQIAERNAYTVTLQ